MNKTFSLYMAMILAGVAGYFVLWFSVRTLEPLDYAVFATFWSALYFLVGSLAGFQQEVTRASRPRTREIISASHGYRGATFNLALSSAAVIVALGLIAFLGLSFQDANSEYEGFLSSILPITVSLAGYVVVAVIAGSLYGLHKWLLLAFMIIGDAALRLIFVLWVLTTSGDVELLIWAVSVPFGLTILVLSPWLRKALSGKVVTDVPVRKLWQNSLEAVLAAVGMSLIVSGFPLLLSMTSHDATAAALSQSMFIVTLARAPFVIVAISLQSLLLVKFKEALNPLWLISRIGLLFLGLSIILIPLGLFVSQPILEFLVGSTAELSPVLLTAIVISALLLALLVITGVAVLAQSKHFWYLTGWALAAFLTLVCLVLPLDFEIRVSCALLIAPVIGVSVHVYGIKKK